MTISKRRRSLVIGDHRIDVGRNEDGVLQLWASDDLGLAAGLGFAHAHDRMVQMMLVRLVGQGRLGECLQSDAETLTIDKFARGMGFRQDAESDVANLEAGAHAYAAAYARGVNFFLRRHRRPFEFAMVGYRPEPWTVADTLITIKLMTYVGLAQTQQDFEKLIIQALRGGVSVDRLSRLVAPHLDGLDEATIANLRDLRWMEPLLPDEIRFLAVVPTVSASNNWAVSGKRRSNGSPLVCFDPHMEVNRLPAVWYEVVMHTDTDYRLGITMPGVPGVVMGRTRDLAFGFTYGFMDMVDYFVEDCRDGRCRRGDDWQAVEVRTERILRKGKDPVDIRVRTTSNGVLESDSRRDDLPDGLYLARAWSNQVRAASPSLDALYRILNATNVPEAQKILKNVTISCNWILADRDGNIGYQQSGRLPARRHSGLHPVPGWDTGHVWHGDVDPEELLSLLNPVEGFLATANNDLNPPEGPLVINLSMGTYRSDRILCELGNVDPTGTEDMRRIQLDVYSLQAKRFMEVLLPHLPDVPAAEILRDWDFRYDRLSRGATVFEDVYFALLRKVFGEGLFGTKVWDAIVSSTTIVADYYHLFDDVILGDDPAWFGDVGREGVFADVLDDVLRPLDAASVPTWGERTRVVMRNIFFGGRLPKWLGFDHGPIELEGNRATVVQAQLFTAYGRASSFGVSWRFISDMGEDEARTIVPGGPSGRRLSRWYRSEIDRWLRGEYKVLRPEP